MRVVVAPLGAGQTSRVIEYIISYRRGKLEWERKQPLIGQPSVDKNGRWLPNHLEFWTATVEKSCRKMENHFPTKVVPVFADYLVPDEQFPLFHIDSEICKEKEIDVLLQVAGKLMRSIVHTVSNCDVAVVGDSMMRRYSVSGRVGLHSEGAPRTNGKFRVENHYGMLYIVLPKVGLSGLLDAISEVADKIGMRRGIGQIALAGDKMPELWEAICPYYQTIPATDDWMHSLRLRQATINAAVVKAALSFVVELPMRKPRIRTAEDLARIVPPVIYKL